MRLLLSISNIIVAQLVHLWLVLKWFESVLRWSRQLSRKLSAYHSDLLFTIVVASSLLFHKLYLHLFLVAGWFVCICLLRTQLSHGLVFSHEVKGCFECIGQLCLLHFGHSVRVSSPSFFFFFQVSPFPSPPLSLLPLLLPPSRCWWYSPHLSPLLPLLCLSLPLGVGGSAPCFPPSPHFCLVCFPFPLLPWCRCLASLTTLVDVGCWWLLLLFPTLFLFLLPMWTIHMAYCSMIGAHGNAIIMYTK